MVDYYGLISKAVANLQNPQARRVVYERGRSALLEELNSIIPPLRQSAITTQLAAFEDAIQKMEAEIANRGRVPESNGT